MIVIFNTNGSIYDAEMADYVQQGSNGANRLQVAYVDSARSGLSAYLIAERPNGTSITLPAHKASFDCNGERYQGWEVTITGSFTLYAGVVHCTLNIVDEDDQIQANYPFDVTVNATGNPIDADWDEQINVAQYNAFMAMLSDKATINRVESKDELPIPGQRSVLWLVGTDKYDAYAWDPESEEYRTVLNGIYVVGNIATADINGLPDGYIIYSSDTASIYEKDASVQAGYTKLYDIASKSWVGSNYVPYNGANDDVDLGEHKISAKELDLPQGKLRTDSVDDYATLLDGQFVYDNDYTNQKEDERAISSVKYVLENHLQLTSNISGTLDEYEYAYASKPNAVIIDKNGTKAYRLVNDRGGFLYFACFNNHIDTQADGNTISFGWLLTINKSTKAYLEEEIAISLYSKDQAKDKFATNFTASLDTTTYVLTFTLENANGSTLSTQTIDLPLESIVTSMIYYDTYTYDGTTYHNVLVIVLATTSVPTIVPVGSLISGLEHEALVEVSDISTPLTASQLALMEYPNAMIKYGYDVYLKAEDNGTYITLSVPYISLTTNSGHQEATRKFIVVTKSSGAMTLTSDTTSFYNKSQTDSLLGEKADASSVVTDSDIETLGGAVTRIRKGDTWNEVAEQVNMSTTPKVVQSVADLPADNDGYLYVVLDNGYLYSWDEENQEWAQQYQYTSDLLTITEVEVGDDDYSHIEDKTNNNRPIQVESAKKDGNGEVIDETYAKISDIETIDDRLDNHDTEIAKLKKDVDYALKYPLLYGQPTTDTEEEVGLTTSQLPATTLPKGLINYVGGMSQKVNQNRHSTSGSINENVTKWRLLFTETDLTLNYGHKYFVRFNMTLESDNEINPLRFKLGHDGYGQFSIEVTNGLNEKIAVLDTQGGAQVNRSFFHAYSNGLAHFSFSGLMIVDLTSIYGAGNEPTSTDDMRIKWLIHYLTENPEYDEGSIVNAPVEKLSSKGFNIWDEEWELGSIGSIGQAQSSNLNIRSKYTNPIKVLPNTEYKITQYGTSADSLVVYFYDKDGNHIEYTGTGAYSGGFNTSQGLFTTPSNCAFIRFRCASSYGTTYNHDICINLSGSINGTYKPYQAPSDYPIPAEVQALDGYGLGIDDTLYNYIDFENKKFVKKVGSYTFTGNEIWTASASAYQANITGLSNLVKKASGNSDVFSWQINNAGLKATSGNELYTGRNTSGIAVIINGNIFIGSDDYANRSNLLGKIVVFELAEPVETDISEYLDRDFPNENLIDTYQGGEVEFENDNDMDVPYSLTYQYKVE